jgi:hypothetical protein
LSRFGFCGASISSLALLSLLPLAPDSADFGSGETISSFRVAMAAP